VVPPAFAPPPSAPPPNSMGEVPLPSQIPQPNLGEEGGALEGAVTGARVSLTALRIWMNDESRHYVSQAPARATW
jgi:hypothetical protein